MVDGSGHLQQPSLVANSTSAVGLLCTTWHSQPIPTPWVQPPSSVAAMFQNRCDWAQ